MAENLDVPITDVEVINQIREAMPVATFSQRGLMNNTDKLLIPHKSQGMMTGEMIRVCHIQRSWQCVSFLLLVCCDNQQSFEIIRIYVEGNYDSSKISNYVHRKFIDGSKLVEMYFKDDYIYLRRDDVSANGEMTVIGGVNAFMEMGEVADVSSYKKL